MHADNVFNMGKDPLLVNQQNGRIPAQYAITLLF